MASWEAFHVEAIIQPGDADDCEQGRQRELEMRWTLLNRQYNFELHELVDNMDEAAGPGVGHLLQAVEEPLERGCGHITGATGQCSDGPDWVEGSRRRSEMA